MLARNALTALAVVLATTVSSHAGEDVRLSVVSALPKKHHAVEIFRTRFQDAIAARLAKAEAGEIAWDEHHERTLAHFVGTLEAVEDELALFGIVAVKHEVKRLPMQHMTFRMPFTTEECAVVANAYRHVHETVAGMSAGIEKARQSFVAGMASDGYNIIAVHKISNAGEVRGRAIGMSDRIECWIGGVDGQTLRLPADTIGARLEDGSLVAAVLPTTEIGRLALKLQADHYTRTGFGAQVPFVVTVNTRLFEALPEAIRAAVHDAVPGFVTEAANDYCAAGEAALEALRSQGVRTAKLLKSRRFQWAEALPPLAQQWAKAQDEAGNPGTDAVATYMKQLREAGVTLARDWSAASATGQLEREVIGEEAAVEPHAAHGADG
jgi:TRAP-type C4-dicarboxylate transport system substrate-binding protein